MMKEKYLLIVFACFVSMLGYNAVDLNAQEEAPLPSAPAEKPDATTVSQLNKLAIEHARLAIQNSYTKDVFGVFDRLISYGKYKKDSSESDASLKKHTAFSKQCDQLEKDLILLTKRLNELNDVVFGPPRYRGVFAPKEKKVNGRVEWKTYADCLKQYSGIKTNDGTPDIPGEISHLVNVFNLKNDASRKTELDIRSFLLDQYKIRPIAYTDSRKFPIKRPFPRVETDSKGKPNTIAFGNPLGKVMWTEENGGSKSGNTYNGRLNWDLFHMLDMDFQGWGHAYPAYKKKGEYNFDNVNKAYRALELEEWGYPALQSTPVSSRYKSSVEKYEELMALGDMDIFYPAKEATIQRRKNFNLSHPVVQEMILDSIIAVADKFKNDKRYLAMNTLWEQANNKGAYSKAGIALFQKHLKRKFGSIETLNDRWGTDYTSFGQITAPEAIDKKTQPSYHEIEMEIFSRANYNNWTKRVYETCKEHAPEKPVVIDSVGWIFNGKHERGLDYWANTRDSCDAVSMHYHNALNCHLYLYSLKRVLNKELWKIEYTDWNSPEGWDRATDKAQEAALFRNLFNGVGMGVRLFEFYLARDPYGWRTGKIYSGANMFDYDSGYTLFRPLIGNLPMLSQKIKHFNSIWFNTDVVDPRVAIYQPSLASFVSRPHGTVFKYGTELVELLTENGYHHAVVFEEAILEKRDNLSKYDVILVPYGIHLPSDMSSHFINYVQSGGTLVCAGPAGVYDETGEVNNSVLSKIFNQVQFQYSGVGTDWTASKHLSQYKKDSMCVGEYGKGKVFLFLDPADMIKKQRELQRIIDGSTAAFARSFDQPIQVIPRSGKSGDYLLVINTSNNETVNSDLVLSGDHKLKDLFMGGYDVPAKKEGKFTVIPLKLLPGRSVLYKLSDSRIAMPGKDLINQSLKLRYDTFIRENKVNANDTLKLSDTHLQMDSHEFSQMLYAQIDEIKKKQLLESLKSMKSSLDGSSGMPPAEMARRKLWYTEIRKFADNKTDGLGALAAAESIALNNLKEATKPAKKTINITEREINVDGDESDWNGIAYNTINENIKFKVTRQAGTVNFLVDVKQAKFENDHTWKALWLADCVQIHLDILNCKRGDYKFDDFKYAFGVNDLAFMRNPLTGDRIPEHTSVKSKRKGQGFIMEIAIANELMPDVSGYIVGFELEVILKDDDPKLKRRHFKWAGAKQPHKSTEDWGTLVFE